MNDEFNKKREFKQQFKKRCFNFSIEILKLSESLREKKINWIIINQVTRSSTSIGANVVEGNYSISKKEFINFFQIALKSAAETLYWLALLYEINQEKQSEINKMTLECQEIKKLLSTIILNSKNKYS